MRSSASVAYIRVRWLSFLPQRTLAIAAHLASSVSLFALYVALMLTHEAVAIIVVSAMPFVFAGIAVSYYYGVRRSDRAAATYVLDLSGLLRSFFESLVGVPQVFRQVPRCGLGARRVGRTIHR